MAKIEAKLGNDQFMAKAPEEVVEEQRERLAESADLLRKMDAALSRLSA
jgi:valyl-tRNA synthetase